eukprot:3938922-Rhodomonas_salina.3
MAFQLAHYRLFGHTVSTYESANQVCQRPMPSERRPAQSKASRGRTGECVRCESGQEMQSTQAE